MITHSSWQQRFAASTIYPLYVNLQSPQQETPEHKHDYLELVIVFAGKGEQYSGLYREEVKTGSIFLVPLETSHGYRNCSPDFSLINILFLPASLPLSPLDVSMLPGFQLFYADKGKSATHYPCIHASEEEFQHISALAKELYQEYQQEKPGKYFCCIGIFMQLLCHIVRIYSNTAAAKPKSTSPISQVFAYLNSHFKQNVTLPKLCRISNMSKSSLMRNFQSAAGCSPIQFLIRLRVSEAMRLLCATNLPIAEVALCSGFQESNYFGRQFKKITGKTPCLYRRECQTKGFCAELRN